MFDSRGLFKPEPQSGSWARTAPFPPPPLRALSRSGGDWGFVWFFSCWGWGNWWCPGKVWRKDSICEPAARPQLPHLRQVPDLQDAFARTAARVATFVCPSFNRAPYPRTPHIPASLAFLWASLQTDLLWTFLPLPLLVIYSCSI